MNRMQVLMGAAAAVGIDPASIWYPGCSWPKARAYTGTVDQQQARIVAAEAKRDRKCERRLREVAAGGWSWRTSVASIEDQIAINEWRRGNGCPAS